MKWASRFDKSYFAISHFKYWLVSKHFFLDSWWFLFEHITSGFNEYDSILLSFILYLAWKMWFPESDDTIQNSTVLTHLRRWKLVCVRLCACGCAYVLLIKKLNNLPTKADVHHIGRVISNTKEVIIYSISVHCLFNLETMGVDFHSMSFNVIVWENSLAIDFPCCKCVFL